ncbi:DNA replication and repair RecF family protein [Chlamydia ibidis]|uniref:DNA replication and repair protein RecF n=2 Tax=Chlamydia ibidis TaxID=1405396 RepID=S7KHE8_9CHLA|nr:DNA replication/repair protein RecF [Chlamydia ibidis]EPP35601.1 DNA replication and repair RecF family protein [Chlamydia ibidis]EQM62782.1 DNA replication and repair RecF family protein [Chlamydia ibidis 10-1398/6]
MNIVSLYLKDFRNHKDTTIRFAPRMNYIFGNNAQGKTNILEALYVLSLGRSFRTQRLSEAIAFGHDYFFLKMHFVRESIPHTLSIYVDKIGKKVLYDDIPIKTLSQLLGIIPTVLSSSRDQLLISGTPSDRRLFLNLLLSQSDHEYSQKLTYYQRALNQRNALLKTKHLDTLSVWNEQLATLGATLTVKRYICCQKINLLLKSLWNNSLGENLLIKFKSSCIKQNSLSESSVAEELHKQLESSLQRDLDLGNTTVGPHREDFSLMLNELSVSQFSSEGQKHSLLALLRLAECLYLKEIHSICPLFCMDDIHAGLDSQRVSNLLNLYPFLQQTIITSTNPPSYLPTESRSFLIDQSQPSLLSEVVS